MDVGLLTDTLTRLILGLGIGFAVGMTGIGAGILVIPSLLHIVGLPSVSAVGTGLLYSMLTKSYGAYTHFRLRTIRKRTAFYIILGGAPAVLATSFFIAYLDKILGSGLDFALRIIIGAVMLITWILMLRNLIKNRKGGPMNYYVPLKHFPRRRKLYGIAAGAGVGVLLGSTSIGGGALIALILITVFQLSPNNTVGTSVLIGIIMSAVGALAYILRGNIDVTVAVTMFIGSLPGVYLGARAAVKLPHRVLSAMIFTVVTISVIVMFAGIK